MCDIINLYAIKRNGGARDDGAIDGRAGIQERARAAGGKKPYTPRPKSHIILAWVLLAIVIFAIGGMCYWEMFGKF